MTQVDPVAAIVQVLKDDATIAAIVAGRVFGGELPNAEDKNMPRPAIVVKPAGGGLLGQSNDYGDTRVDIDCYSQTLYGSWLLHLTVHKTLKSLVRQTKDVTLLHWARISSGGVTARDPQTTWPLTISSWQILASEIAVP